jgi:integrase
MEIEKICALLIDALQGAGYNESTIFNYHGVIRRFKAFSNDRGETSYTPDLGKMYAEDVVSVKTSKFSMNRYHTQGRFIRFLDSYFHTCSFDFSMKSRGRVSPENQKHKTIYHDYGDFLRLQYSNENTARFYEYEMYCLLQYMESLRVVDTAELTSAIIIRYIQNSKINRQRAILCGLRMIFKYLKRDDLFASIVGIRAQRTKRIIPVLTDDEQQSIRKAIESSEINLRDSAIVIMGLTTGIRACDLIRLKLSDIDWGNETISFSQSKTGNIVCLPLTPPVGNALARYITEERPVTKYDHIFVRQFAPYGPFADHAACHSIVSSVFRKAGICRDGRMAGMHMLRHNAASTMVRNAVPIETIAAVLGHSSPDTTDIYITTDEHKLKECVLPMSGISTEVHP